MSELSSKIAGANPVFEQAELVLGLVAPVGTNFDLFQHPLIRHLEPYGYKANVVRVSELISNFDLNETESPTSTGTEEFCRINRAMHAGNLLRLRSRRGEVLALAAAKAIYDRRPEAEDQVIRNGVHVVRSLKHPDEVRALRRIYGSGFYLVGLNVDEEQRRKHLKNQLGCRDGEIDLLLARDENEEDPQYVTSDGQNYGQRTTDTFHLADAFLTLDSDEQLERFLKLIFGCPFETPHQDEHAMFMAFASALRSADLSRQVGAVVVSEAGNLISTGANDVPRPTGGLYWPGSGDQRDMIRGEDSNDRRRDEIVADIVERLRPADADADTWAAVGKSRLRDSPLMDITEYGRAVHAEMEALMSCARTGVSPVGGTLYSTTFPCHNCAKHIVAAGIKRVVYVEPYPKSQALTLFPDSIQIQSPQLKIKTDKVVFEPFIGVGPRRFFDLFSVALSSGIKLKRKERKNGGKKASWTKELSNIRVPMLPNSYVQRELAATRELIQLTASPGEEDAKDSP